MNRWENTDSGSIVAADTDADANADDTAKNGPFLSFWGYKKWHFGCPNQNSETTFRDPNHPQNPQLDHLGTQIGPRKVIFGYFIEFGHFPIEIPIEVNKITDSGRSGPTTKTKSVPKSVNKMEQLENMLKLKFQLSSK